MTDPAFWERRRTSFDRTAEAYDLYRPGYPDALFDDIRSYASLRGDDRILEIGSGTGKATRQIASWGHPVLCIEPAAGMAAVAMRNLSEFSNVEMRVESFEAWDVEPAAFGLVASGQAYHWLDPQTRDARIARALRPGGVVALFWNGQYVPDETRTFFERVQLVYARHAPDLVQESFPTADRLAPHPLGGSGDVTRQPSDDDEHFVDRETRKHPWSWRLDRDRYLALLATHSPHAALGDEVREGLLGAIGELIDSEFGGEVIEHYTAVLHLARRR